MTKRELIEVLTKVPDNSEIIVQMLAPDPGCRFDWWTITSLGYSHDDKYMLEVE